MKLEEQVTCRELSEKLKKLGVKQESLWYWCQWKDWVRTTDNHNKFQLKSAKEVKIFNPSDDGRLWFKEIYSAFTVAELGEMLPKRHFSTRNSKAKWWCSWINKEHGIYNHIKISTTEANARAKMLIYLKEKELI